MISFQSPTKLEKNSNRPSDSLHVMALDEEMINVEGLLGRLLEIQDAVTNAADSYGDHVINTWRALKPR